MSSPVPTQQIASTPPRPVVPRWLERWFDELAPSTLDIAVDQPHETAVIAVDMVNGFCEFGSLSSRRFGDLAQPVTDLFQRLHNRGVRDFVLLQDAHDPSAPEFAAYPRHNVRHSAEADTIRQLRELPFADTFTVLLRNSLHPAIDTKLDEWLADHSRLRTIIVVGAGTDLSVYQTAMHLRLRANALGLSDFRVVVPADAVETYHMPVLIARMEGKLSHVGDYFQLTFLYHLMLNGVEVVKSLDSAEVRA